MSIFHDIQQNTPEWFNLRAGVATSSCFGKIITPTAKQNKKTGSYLSTQADAYADRLISEMILGEPQETFFQSYWMERGALMEVEAKKLYEFETGYTLGNGGFITNDAGTLGCSPDARVFNEAGDLIGGIEVKCPAPFTHVGNLLRDEIDPQYIPQVQGQILIGEFEFIDWFSFHPDMPPAKITTERDDEFCEKLDKALKEFEDMVSSKVDKLLSKGVIINSKEDTLEPAPDVDLKNITMAG